MTALNITDLNNGKQDVDHIAALATSEALTATDRLGRTKRTWSGLEAELNSEYAITQTGINRAASQTSAAAAELARVQAGVAKDGAVAAGEVAGSFTTLALATAAVGSIAADRAVYVTADGTNDGYYVKRSGALVRESLSTLPAVADAGVRGGTLQFFNYDVATSTGSGEFVATTAGAINASVFCAVKTVDVGAKVTLLYRLVKSGANSAVNAFLANGASASVGVNPTLTCDGMLRTVTLSADSNPGVRLVLLQAATGVSKLEGNIVLIVGDATVDDSPVSPIVSAVRALLRMAAVESAGMGSSLGALRTASVGVGPVTGAPTFTGFTAYTNPSQFEFETQVAAAGNGYIIYPCSIAQGDSVTLIYRLHKKGAGNVTAWLANGANANQSGGTFALACDDTTRVIVLTATAGAAMRLLLQQIASDAGGFGGFVVVLAGNRTGTSSDNGLASALLAQSRIQAVADAAAQTRIGALEGASGSTRTIARSLVPVSARNGLAITASTAGTHYAQSIRRRYLNGSTAVTKLRVRLANWYVTAAGVETANANDIKVAISIEYPIGTAPKPFTFKGQSDFVIPAGKTVDAVEASGFELPENASFYIHTFARGWVGGTAGGVLPIGRFTVTTGFADMVAYDGAAADKTAVVSGETTAVAAPASLFSHFALLGEPEYRPVGPSVIINGDSIPFGFNENNSMSGDTNGCTGPFERWLSTNGIGAINLSVPSTKASQWAGLASGQYPRVADAVAGLGTHVLLSLGRNDVPTDAADVVMANISMLANWWMAQGVRPVGVTVTPKSTSTDNWATTANQTTDAVSQPRRVAHNVSLRTQASRPAIMKSYLDLAVNVETALDSGIWQVTGAANGYTSDGVHPQRALNVLVAAALPATAAVLV